MSESVEEESDRGKRAYRFKAALFLATAGGIGLLAGFSGALAAVKKQDPQSFDKVPLQNTFIFTRFFFHAYHDHEMQCFFNLSLNCLLETPFFP